MDAVVTRIIPKYSCSSPVLPTFASNSWRPIPKDSTFSRFSQQKFQGGRRTPALRSVSASSWSGSSCFGGWEDVEVLDDSMVSAELDPARYFLFSIGINDGKKAFLFCLGFMSALAVSRVKLPTMAIMPVSVLVFLAGLSVGIAQGGGVVDLLKQFSRKRSDTKGFDDKEEFFIDFLNDLDCKMADLKGGLERIGHSNHVEIGEIKRYIDVVESVRLAAPGAKKYIEDKTYGEFSDGMMVSDLEDEQKSNHMPGKRTKEMSTVSFDFIRSIVGLFQESLVESEAPKKENIKKETVEQFISSEEYKENSALDEIFFASEAKGNDLYQSTIHNVDNAKTDTLSETSADRKHEVRSQRLGGRKQNTIDRAKVESDDERRSSDSSTIKGDLISFKEEHSNLERSFNRQKCLQTTILRHKRLKRNMETLRNSQEEKDSSGVGMNLSAEKIELLAWSDSDSSLQLESTFEMHNGNSHSHCRKVRKSSIQQENYRNGSVEGVIAENESISNDQDVKSNTSKSISCGEEFTRALEEATELLKQAREYLKSDTDEEAAEIILYKSADLLSTAVALKPMSLLAVGQLGNTLLLHGELKLKFSREMRNLLSSSNSMERKGYGVQLDDLRSLSLNKEEVASMLVDVCEECEELLVEAGRNYRMALSIDGSDIRALYNWGLALYFRAELIADVGPEAAFDADKVYLAAIDKFAAITSRSNVYAPDGLFRWGLALQQRSNLVLHDNKEKMKLLRQAKSLFEEVLSIGTNNRPVREALLSCISEIKYNRQL